MINAHEALELAEQNEENYLKILQVVDAQIRAAAEKGKRQLLFYEDGYWHSTQYTHDLSPSAKQRRLMDELEKHGFALTFGKISEGYVPRGLTDDFGDGPLHYNIGITISW